MSTEALQTFPKNHYQYFVDLATAKNTANSVIHNMIGTYVSGRNVIDVLLVEDTPDDYEITRHVLEDKHIRYHHVRDGEAAVKFVFSSMEGAEPTPNGIHLILLDLKLPKLNGLEVLKKIRNDKRTHNIPVVILSSTDDSREIAEAYDLGANSFVIKPIEFEKFVKMLSTIFLYWMHVNEHSTR